MIELKINGKDITVPKELEEQIMSAMPKQSAGKWKPKEDEWYYFIADYGEIDCAYYLNDHSGGKWRLSQVNCFPTEEAAEVHKRYLEAIARLKNSSDFVPGLNGDNYYVVRYGLMSKQLVTNEIGGSYLFSDLVKYETEELAEQSIKDHKEDWLLYFGVES